MLTIEAPAKINLTLEILRKREDGYHEIRSVMQAVGLRDTLTFEKAEVISFCSETASWKAEKSLVSRAAEMLRQRAVSPCGALITVKKRIPLSSGLGGDSSDAAAVMQGLNQLWDLGIPPGELVESAANLGSDVAFFFSGGTALAEGRGEIISPLPDMIKTSVILLMPHVPLPESKTAAMYSRIHSDAFTSGVFTDDVVARLTRGEPVLSCHLFNVFDKLADEVFPGLKKVRDEFQEIARKPVLLAGAGPALYALFNDEEAVYVYKALKNKGYETYLAETQNSLEL
jgi:4-diphosphocytidyl-2-C-methyl-D-erythritol kinase